MKKRMIFVVSQLAVGGAQKSMIKALSVIDYSQYDVSLYVREKKTDLLSSVPKEVNVIFYDGKDYSHSLIPLACEVLRRITAVLRINKLKKFIESISNKYVIASKYKYEKKTFFDGVNYDIAIAYMNGHICELVADYVDADRKMCFYLGSSDNMPKLHKRCLPLFDNIVSDSDGTAQFLKNHIPEIANKISVIANYVDYQEVRQKSSEALVDIDKNENTYVFCSCGRFSCLKGFDLAVEAAKVLKEKKIPFKWYFVGDGPERLKIDSLIDNYGLNDNICITGIVNNPYPYIKNCDIYVQPSYEESYGLTITEAKILCKPIVSTETVGGKHQITHMVDGILTDFTGIDIADGIVQYINNKEIKDRVVSNLENIDYTHNFIEFSEKWKKLLEE